MGKLCLPQKGTPTPGYADKCEEGESEWGCGYRKRESGYLLK